MATLNWLTKNTMQYDTKVMIHMHNVFTFNAQASFKWYTRGTFK